MGLAMEVGVAGRSPGFLNVRARARALQVLDCGAWRFRGCVYLQVLDVLRRRLVLCDDFQKFINRYARRHSR